MGWKNVKEHYRVSHIVQVQDEHICIGSGYLPRIIVIAPDGTFVKREDSTVNEQLCRYQSEMDSDPKKLVQLVQTPDVFEQSITVYTFDGEDIVERKCEAPGWPNCTHDGELMYENIFFESIGDAARKAKSDSRFAIKWAAERIAECEGRLDEAKADLSKWEAVASQLAKRFPEPQPSDS